MQALQDDISGQRKLDKHSKKAHTGREKPDQPH